MGEGAGLEVGQKVEVLITAKGKYTFNSGDNGAQPASSSISCFVIVEVVEM